MTDYVLAFASQNVRRQGVVRGFKRRFSRSPPYGYAGAAIPSWDACDPAWPAKAVTAGSPCA